MLLQDLKITERFNWKRPVFKRNDLGLYLRKNWERICAEEVLTRSMVRKNEAECEKYMISVEPRDGFYCIVDDKVTKENPIIVDERISFTAYVHKGSIIKAADNSYIFIGPGMISVSDFITVYGGVLITSKEATFRNNSKGFANGNCNILARDNSAVVATGNVTISTFNNSKAHILQNVSATAYDYSKILAEGFSEVKAMNESKIVAKDSSNIIGTMQSTIEVYDKAKTNLFDDSKMVSHTDLYKEIIDSMADSTLLGA